MEIKRWWANEDPHCQVASALGLGKRFRIGFFLNYVNHNLFAGNYSLARAVYTKASIYLFDDPLSAVDAHVGKHLFDKVIGPNGFLAQEKAARILVTHQVHLVQDAEHIVVVDHGRIMAQGNFNELALSGNVDSSNLAANPNNQEQHDVDALVVDEVTDIVDMSFVGRARSGSTLSKCSVNSEKTVN